MGIFLKIKKRLKNKFKFLINKISYRYEKFVPDTLQSSSYLNLGDDYSSELPFPSANINNANIYLDITKNSYKWMHSKYQFIWSERMLEHIQFSKIKKALLNIEKLLSKNGRCRMCLPICFYGNQKIDMVREGNSSNSNIQGHVTWFTFSELGPITEECFGMHEPPINLGKSWEEILKDTQLTYFPIRHYNPDSSLYVNKDLYCEVKGVFLDEPQVKIKRKNSLIFDLVKNR